MGEESKRMNQSQAETGSMDADAIGTSTLLNYHLVHSDRWVEDRIEAIQPLSNAQSKRKWKEEEIGSDGDVELSAAERCDAEEHLTLEFSEIGGIMAQSAVKGRKREIGEAERGRREKKSQRLKSHSSQRRHRNE